MVTPKVIRRPGEVEYLAARGMRAVELISTPYPHVVFGVVQLVGEGDQMYFAAVCRRCGACVRQAVPERLQVLEAAPWLDRRDTRLQCAALKVAHESLHRDCGWTSAADGAMATIRETLRLAPRLRGAVDRG